MKIDQTLDALRSSRMQSSADAPLRASTHQVWHRLAFVGPVVGGTLGGMVLAVSATAGVTSPLRWPLLVLVAISLFYMAVTGTPGMIGFVLHLLGRRFRPAAAPTGLSRTAVLMPIHNEDPIEVFARIEVMARAVGEAGLTGLEFFVLSDTRAGAVADAEAAEYAALMERVPAGSAGFPAIRYRRRAENAGRKAGNLAEFCGRWGSLFDYMVVVDADSLMGASAFSRLIGLMDASPRTGIVQSVPYPVGRNTIFARLQQFSARLYSPLLIEGLAFWQQGDANYWGHNAIIRVEPFMAHCTLPVLPGPEPFGGEILCHDVVEAGLMRGAGWDVWVLPEVLESYEAVPANMVDYGARERRWCQGNLQHVGVLPLPGFSAVGRFHLFYGIVTYLAAPAALLFLLLASVDAVMGGGFVLALLHGPAGTGLAVLGAVLLYAGKVSSLLAVLADADESRKYGGRLALLTSAIVEQLAACVLSALLIVSYSRYTLDLLRGRAVRWESQPRDDRGVGWAEAWLRTRGPVLIGLGWLALLPFMPVGTRGWTLPLLLGLLAGWPLTVWSSRVDWGRWCRRAAILLTPEEAAPAPILRAFERAIPGTTPGTAIDSGVALTRLVPEVP